MPTNQELIPIYTDWANRHLAKTNHRPISDLSNELRDYRIVANIVFSIVPDPEQCTLFKNKLNAVASNIEGLNACLNFLQSIGVNCTKVTAAGIDTGQLSSVLQLLFSLSTFKQQEKHRRKEERTEKQTVMPPSTTTKLPSLHSPQSLASTASPSKLQTPSRLAHPKSSLLQPSTPQKTSALRPPTTGLRPPSRGSGNNNGSVISSGRSSVASSATYTSIPSVASATTTTSRAIPKPVTTPKKSQLQAPKSSQSTLLKPPSSASPARQPETATQSKMMKLKLFGGKDKEKKDKTPQPSPAQTRKTVVPASVPKMTASKITLGNSRPTEAKTTKLAPPSKKQPVQLRVKQPSLVPPSTARPTKEEKRTSKSSEEDSAYAGFGSTSPSSSTQSSISLRSASSKGSREAVCETKMETPTQPAVSQRRGSETQDKPTLAVKAIRVAPSRISKPAEKKKNSGELLSTPSPSEEKVPVQSPTVGIVSPMMHRKQVEASPELRVECEPSSSKTEEKKKPPVPSRGNSRLETTFDAEVTSSQVPSMPPVRQPPSYTQLLTEGKINKKGSHFDSSTSEDSLDSITTTVRTPAARGSGCASAGNTIDRSARGNSQDSSGYISESGLAIYEKMQARLRECRDSVRKAHFDYGDSFEDSSSLSSGISENFDDISTDDLSGPDHPMAAATYGKPSDYQPFTRSSNGRGPRSSSSSMDSRARRVAEQENLHQLLQQCRTSQRGAACGSLRSPGYGTSGGYGPHLTLSADGDTLSVHSRGSLRASSNRKDQTVPSLGGYHSLDRKSHLSEMYGDDGRLSIWDQRNTMALVSPRRVPQQQDSHRHSVTASLNASGMSRSMVMLESEPSPRPQRRCSPRARGASPRGPRARMPLSVASPVHSNKGSLSARGGSRSESIYAAYKDPMQLQRLADEPQHSPSHSVPDPMGSQLSLASSTAYASLNDKYESELRKMNRELDGYRHTVSKLTRRHDDYAQLMEVFDQRLAYLGRHVEKAQLRPDELAKLRTEIEHLRDMSSRVAQTADARKTLDGAGELLRQPSLESVASMASHRSSMSSSSKSSKTDKTSLSSFGKTKKSWTSNVDVQIRSSFSKAFSKKKGKGGGSDTEGSPMHLNTISGSTNRLDEVEVVELKKQLEDRDVTLTDVRLDALDRAREVDVLRETVNRLKHENKQLKQDMTRILARSRASSQTSLAMNDDEPVYEVPPSSSQGSYSSKRSSGCDSVKVTVNVDLRGTISTAICPDNEIIIGFLPTPVKDSTWEELDQQIYALFDSYIGRIDPDRLLGLHCSESVIGYQMGDVVRQKGAESPKTTPTDVISPTTTVRMFLRGACQQSVDSLVLECLFPRSMLEQLLRFLLSHRRLVLSGATGIGKSNLARQLASYLSVRIGLAQDAVQDIQIPDDTTDKGIVKVEKQLEGLLRGSAQGVVLMDNIPRHRIAFVSSVFSSVQLALDDGPFVICTVNRACQLPEMQVHHNFKMFLLTNRMDGVKGFMGRFLRRRIIEAEFRLSRPTAPELLRVIQFLPTVLQAVNTFIEKANSLDVTVGPRIFLQCPLGIEESREWFVRLWNENVVPYMVRVAREGVKVLGRCGTFEDPTDTVCEHWPWVNGPSGEELLSRLSIKDIGGGQVTKQPFNPLDTLIRLQASRNAAIENI